jgi:hypothetical protein
MKVCICASAFFADEVNDTKKKLEQLGFEVTAFPNEIEIDGRKIPVKEYYRMRKENLTDELLDIRARLVNEHIKKIECSDAVLVLNLDKDGKEGYIGGNVFLEMGVAHHLGKKIFVWKNPSRSLPYYEEIASLKTVVIGGNLQKIK